MTYVLDTNAVSALMKGTAAVVERLAAIQPGHVRIPQPVLAEIAYGIERLPRSKRREALHARFELVCSELQRTEWTDAVSHVRSHQWRRWNDEGCASRISTPRSPHMRSRSRDARDV